LWHALLLVFLVDRTPEPQIRRDRGEFVNNVSIRLWTAEHRPTGYNPERRAHHADSPPAGPRPIGARRLDADVGGRAAGPLPRGAPRPARGAYAPGIHAGVRPAPAAGREAHALHARWSRCPA